MLARLSAFVIWALVAATAVFWGLRLFVRAQPAPAYAVAVGDSSAARGDLTRLLGASAAPGVAVAAAPEAASRFRLLGIVAPKTGVTDNGVALIAVDGKMPKAFVVGAALDGDLVLQSVSLRTASIGAAQGGPAITLELPAPAVAATGTLPVGGTPVPAASPVPIPNPPQGVPVPGRLQPSPGQPPQPQAVPAPPPAASPPPSE